jgi:hypothetical protein
VRVFSHDTDSKIASSAKQSSYLSCFVIMIYTQSAHLPRLAMQGCFRLATRSAKTLLRSQHFLVLILIKPIALESVLPHGDLAMTRMIFLPLSHPTNVVQTICLIAETFLVVGASAILANVSQSISRC